MPSTRDRNLPANLKLKAPGPTYNQEDMRQAFRIIEQHYHLQLLETASGGAVCFDIYCGTGSPEGVVTAVPDSLYVQTDAATTSHPYWVKISGTGNTGWRGWVGLRGSGTASIRIGDDADASATNSQAYGDDSAATAQDAIAIGRTTANNRDQVNIGRGNSIPTATGQLGQVLIGSDNAVLDSESVSGGGAYHDIIIGASQDIDHTAFGEIIQAIGGDNVIKGDALLVYGYNMVLEEQGGNHGTLSGDCTYGVVIGQNISAYADCFVVIGYQCSAFGVGAVAVGPHAVAGVDDRNVHCTALGRFAKSLADYSTALGGQALVSAGHTSSIALGDLSFTTAANQFVIGSFTKQIQSVRFNARNSGTSNGAGPDVTIQAAAGTGTGTPGALLFQTTVRGSSGTTVQSSYSTKLRITENGITTGASRAQIIFALSADTTLDATHDVVFVSAATAKTITLPTAASAFANSAGRVYTIKRTGAGGVTVAANGSENIDTANTYSLRSQYDSVTVQSDGTQWWIVAKVVAPVTGSAVLVAGTVTVTTAFVTASSRIFLSVQVAGGTQGFLSVGTVTAGTSFVINSTSGTDTSTVVWQIIEP